MTYIGVSESQANSLARSLGLNVIDTSTIKIQVMPTYGMGFYP